MVFAERAKGLLAAPAVDGQVVPRNEGVTEQFGSQVLGRGAEKLRPGSIGPVGSLKTSHFVLSNLKLPDHNKHVNLNGVLMVAQVVRRESAAVGWTSARAVHFYHILVRRL